MLNPKKSSELDEILGFKTEIKHAPTTLSGMKDMSAGKRKKRHMNPTFKVRNKSELRRNRVSSKSKLEEQRQLAGSVRSNVYQTNSSLKQPMYLHTEVVQDTSPG